MSFAHPLWLWGVPAAAAIGGILRAAQRLALDRARRLEPRFQGRGAWRGSIFPAAGLGLIALALARPRWGYHAAAATTPETDAAIVLDTSGSMLVRDVSPDRFSRVKLFLRETLRDLPETVRIALVRVEGEGEVVSPLTLDREALRNDLDELSPRGAETPGSDLGDGVRKATALLSGRIARSRAIVLFSDGEDLDAGLEAAVSEARSRGIVVHAVCAGTPAGGPVPARNGGFLADARGGPVVSHADLEKLRALAAETGGVFLSAGSSPGPLAARLRNPGASGSGEKNREPADRSAWPLALAIGAWSAAQVPRRREKP